MPPVLQPFKVLQIHKQTLYHWRLRAFLVLKTLTSSGNAKGDLAGLPWFVTGSAHDVSFLSVDQLDVVRRAGACVVSGKVLAGGCRKTPGTPAIFDSEGMGNTRHCHGNSGWRVTLAMATGMSWIAFAERSPKDPPDDA